MAKEENVGNQHFVRFPQCFLSHLDQSKIWSFNEDLSVNISNVLLLFSDVVNLDLKCTLRVLYNIFTKYKDSGIQ